MVDYEFRPGISTRVATLTDGTRVRFSLEAVQKAAADVGTRPLPIGLEHLNYLPPRGWVTRGEVADTDDGESEVIWHGHSIQVGYAPDLRLPAIDVTAGQTRGPETGGIRVGTVARNFRSEDWEQIRGDAPVRLEENEAWSALPPLIWTISGLIVWSGGKYFGAIFETLGSAHGKSLAEWISRSAKKAKEPHRDSLAELRLDIPNGPTMLGYCVLSPGDAHQPQTLEQAFGQVASLAEFAQVDLPQERYRGLRRIAFLWSDGAWHLAWWASDDDVHVTPWFQRNCPDAERFLGYPLPDAFNVDPSDTSPTSGG